MTSFAPHTPTFARFIASCLYTARREKGLTQKALAQKAGVRTATVCRAENSPESMNVATLQKIATALNLTLLLQPADVSHKMPTNPRIRCLS